MRKIINIDKDWFFTKEDDINAINNPKFDSYEKVDLPHTWNNLDGQDGGDDYYRGGCWYYKKFDLKPQDNEIYLEIKGASLVCDVYLNGVHLKEHRGGFSTFRVNLSFNIANNDNVLAIRVDNGKTHKVYPLRADFTFFGGLYRDVNLIEVEKTHFDLDYFGGQGIMITPKVEDKHAEVKVETFVTNPQHGQKLLLEVFEKDGILVETITQAIENSSTTFTIKNPHLWQGIVDPYLYTLRAEIIDSGRIIDQQDINFGIRSFSVDANEGFFLNGKEYQLRGVCRHQDRLNMGWAITAKEHTEDMELIKEVGANTIRLAHYQHDQYFYDLCDKYGMVVWAEIPFISRMYEEREAQENALEQLKELIIQNYNHPSIICWGIANEITLKGMVDGVFDNLKELNALAKSLDQTRYTTIAHMSYIEADGPFNEITDIVSYNHYMGWYYSKVEDCGPRLDADHAKNPTLKMGMSEYGAEGNIYYHTNDPKQSDYSEEYQAYYHEEVLKAIMSRKYLWSTHVWNMFDFASDARDEGGVQGRNQKGLVTYDRKIKKDSFYAYKAYWSKEPFVYIAQRRFAKRNEEKVNIKVYSNLKKVTLFVNNEKIGTMKGEHIFIFNDIHLNMGENIIRVEENGYSDEITLIRQTEFEESYINKDTRKKEDLVTKWHKD
jgi:beta-galactosidase